MFVYFRDADAAGVGVVGGKGWNLGRLLRYGFRVPAGGILAAGAYQSLVESNYLQPAIARVSQTVVLENCATPGMEAILAELRESILAAALPDAVVASLRAGIEGAGLGGKALAVRSSATCEDSTGASFAGIHDSFLNVIGLERIFAAVKGCYASLWTSRAVAYRRRMNIGDFEVAPAVVVMEMVAARTSGVAFSCEPITGRSDRILIEANLGLGETVVSGGADADAFELDVRSFCPVVVSRRIGAKRKVAVADNSGGVSVEDRSETMVPSLTDEEAVRVGGEVYRAMETLGGGDRHQDVEWAFDGKTLWLLQARPVTGAGRSALAGQPDIWSNANLRDAFPMVLSTLTWSWFRNGMDVFFQEPLRKTGYKPVEGARYVRRFNGRMYTNLSLIQWQLYDALGFLPSQVNETIGGHQPEITLPPEKNRRLRHLRRLRRRLRLGLLLAGNKRSIERLFAGTIEQSGNWRRRAGACREALELLNLWEEMHAVVGPVSLRIQLLNMGSGHSFSLLVKELARHLGTGSEATALANRLLAGAAAIVSADQGYQVADLAALARRDTHALALLHSSSHDNWRESLPAGSPFREAFASFIEAFGHRAVYEGDLINPRWHEDPSYVLEAIRGMLQHGDIGALKRRQRETAAAAWAEVGSRVPAWRRPLVRRLARQAARDAELREMGKSVLAKLTDASRAVALAVGELLAQRGMLEAAQDVFHCAKCEIHGLLTGTWDGAGLAVAIAERKELRSKQEVLAAPDLVIDEVPRVMPCQSVSEGGGYRGLGVASGRALGRARVVRHPDEGARLGCGEVLVAPSTDPGWTPLFVRAAGIVMETGGYLSHGAIVAREYGIPAVVNIPGILAVIADGEHVAVDGDRGEVHLEQ